MSAVTPYIYIYTYIYIIKYYHQHTRANVDDLLYEFLSFWQHSQEERQRIWTAVASLEAVALLVPSFSGSKNGRYR